MQILDGVTCGDGYTDAATLQGVWGSNGGYFSVAQFDVYAELQFGPLGQGQWTREVPVPVGNGNIFPGTSGIRFRNRTGGQAAVVSAAIAEKAEPFLSISAATSEQAGVMVKLATIVAVAGGSASFTAIPAGYTNLRIVWNAGNNSAAEADLVLRFNNDSGANYDWSIQQAVNGVSSPASATSQTSMIVGVIGTTSAFFSGAVEIPAYLRGDNTAVGTFAGSSVHQVSGVAGGLWRGAAAVNRIDLLSDVSGFAAGSGFTLYGY